MLNAGFVREGIHNGATQEFLFGGFLLVPALMRLDRDGEPVTLPPTSFQALVLLIENRDRIVTKRELLDKIWSDTTVEENTLNQSISALRKVLGDTRKEARFIATIPGVGYRFVMEVMERPRTAPAPPPEEATRKEGGTPFAKKPAAIALGLIVCIVASVAGWRAISKNDTAVLVLPLESIGSFADDSEYARKGLVTDVEAALARSPGLRVAAGVPAPVLKNGDVEEIARRVKASAVLRGQVRENAGALILTFELVNPATHRILWSDQFGAKRNELESAELRVVAGVDKALGLSGGAREPRKVDPAAHDLYLQGRGVALTRKSADLDRAIALFEKAAAIDPAYADAFTGIADAAGLQAVNGPAPAGVLEKARTAALRAVELDGDSAAAHDALGLVYYAEWNWAEARRELKQALRLNLYDSTAHHRLALVDYAFGDYREAEAELKTAMEINPYAAVHAFTLAELYISARKYDDAIRIGELIIKEFSDSSYPHFLEMQAYRAMGNGPAALNQMRTVSRTEETPSLKAMLAIDEGRPGDARRLLAEMGTDDMYWATVCAELGDRTRMLAILQHLLEARNVIVLAMKDDPVFDSYRKDREFSQLIGRLRLPGAH
jgi:DNA-binding winged helix-turn-helix (wHTH) protein/TolB-like protein/Tfp pilus assembly protein PilF